MYEYPSIWKVVSVRRKVYEYLSMTSDYTTVWEVKIDMRKYVKNMIDDFFINIDKSQAVVRPWTIVVRLFHTTVARGLFLCKISRPDIHTTISVLWNIVK